MIEPRAGWLIDWFPRAVCAPYEWSIGRAWVVRFAIFLSLLPWTFVCFIASVPGMVLFLVLQMWPPKEEKQS